MHSHPPTPLSLNILTPYLWHATSRFCRVGGKTAGQRGSDPRRREGCRGSPLRTGSTLGWWQVPGCLDPAVEVFAGLGVTPPPEVEAPRLSRVSRHRGRGTEVPRFVRVVGPEVPRSRGRRGRCGHRGRGHRGCRPEVPRSLRAPRLRRRPRGPRGRRPRGSEVVEAVEAPRSRLSRLSAPRSSRSLRSLRAPRFEGTEVPRSLRRSSPRSSRAPRSPRSLRSSSPRSPRSPRSFAFVPEVKAPRSRPSQERNGRARV